jgi:hypothetical protein
VGGGGGYYPSDTEFARIGEVVRRQLEKAAEEGDKNIFISFAYEDKNEVELLRGQAKNANSDLNFRDYSVKVPYDSEQAEYIRMRIRERIRACSVAVVYLSEHSATSKWVNWEIAEATRLGKGVVGMYKGTTPPRHLPPAIRECGAEVVPWSHQAMMAAIKRASERRTR